MTDASKITVNGETYNVKDPTARDAASAAQTTAAGKLSDAPSDGKEYLRKNGAWAEPSGGGGSGVPDGGTTGQVLAKRSDADGDAGWYSLRHLPFDKWYLPDGILESDVIAAYQFVGRLDEAEALLNVNDGAEYPLSKVLGTETWSVTKGFFIPATSNAGLTNASLAGQYTNMLSAAFGYTEANAVSTTHAYCAGIIPNRNRQLNIKSWVNNTTKRPTMSAFSNTSYYIAGSLAENGVLAGNWETTPSMYRNGESLSLANSEVATPSSGYGKVFGQLNNSSVYHSCYITALVIYKVVLNASQHLELSDNIRALGGGI